MLDIDIWSIVFQIINFLVLFAVLALFMAKPLQRIMKRRTSEAMSLLDDAAQDKEGANLLRREAEERLKRLRVEAEEIRAKAREQTDTEREVILRQAQEETRRLREAARRDNQQEREEALERFRGDIVDVIVGVTSQVLTEIVPPEAHDRLISEISERIYQLGRGEMYLVEEFRRSLGEREPTALVTTAGPLSPEQQRRLAETVSALADRRVTVNMVVDPSLIAGLRVRLGDTILDNSLRHQLSQVGIEDQVERKIATGLQDDSSG